jgi:hypothetical protein
MSTLDRWIRVALIALIAGLLYTSKLTGWPAVFAGLIGFAFLVSGLTGFSPLYALLRVNTARRTRKYSS